MFREDNLTVKREKYELNQGEAVYVEPEIVLENFPCHLSISLNNTVKIYNTPHILSDFTLFLDYDPNIELKENDILYVKTKQGQEYKLYAGEIKIYSLTVQIKCRQNKIIES